MKLKITAVLVVCCGFGVSAWAQCSGVNMGGQCLPPPNVPGSPLYRGENNTSLPPPAVWADRWGAIARNDKTGEWGSGENEKSKTRAEQTAIADCKARTTDGCQIFFTYHNQCVAFAGGTGGVGVAGESKVEDAIGRSIERCSKYGRGCQSVYSACSMPVRIQ